MALIQIDPRSGPTMVQFGDGSSLELVSEEDAATVRELLSDNDADIEPAFQPGHRAMTAGTVAPNNLSALDRVSLCIPPANLHYNTHWPEIGFTTATGIVLTDSDLSGDDLTALHDDRDSEFHVTPDPVFASNYLLDQSGVAVEWESLVWFPKHPAPTPNYLDPPPPMSGNHFGGWRDVSYQSPRAGDQVFVRARKRIAPNDRRSSGFISWRACPFTIPRA